MGRLADYAVRAKYIIVDRMSAAFRAMGGAARAFGNRTESSFNQARRSAGVFRGALAALGVGALFSRMARTVSMGLRKVTSEWISFDDAITQAAAKFPKRIRRGTMAFKRLGEVAREVGATTQFTATEAAGGLNFLAMAGFNAEQAMSLLPGVTNLATVANMDLARTTDIASDVIGAFGLNTKKTSLLTERFARVQDVMAKTITATNTDVEMLFETMKFAGPVATQAGADIETFAAAAGTMAQAGIKASLSGTALRAAFLRLVAPPAAARKALKKLRVETTDSAGNMRDLFDILGDINKGFEKQKFGKAQKLAALAAIFGARAVAGTSILLDKGTAQLKAFRKELYGAGGAAKDMAKDIRQSLGNRIKALQSAAIELGFKFIEAFSKKGTMSIQSLTRAIREFDVAPIVAGVKDFLGVIRDTWNFLKYMGPAVEVAAKAWLGYKAIILAAKGAQWLLNIAMGANPIGLVAMAIVALIAAVAVLIKHWEAMKHQFDVMGTMFRIGIEKMKIWAKTGIAEIVNVFLTGVNVIISAINKIGEVFGAAKLITPFEMIDKASFIKGNVEELERLKKAVGASQAQSLVELAKKDKGVRETLTGYLREKQFARTREAYQAVPTQPAGMTMTPEEFQLPVSGPAPVRSIESPGRRSDFEGVLKIVGEYNKEKSSYRQTKGSPGLDVALLGEAS